METPSTFDAFTLQIHQIALDLLDDYCVPGMAIALVHNGEVAWAQGYGLTDKTSATPVSANTVFQVASISKSVTAWGVMRLVEEGRMALDEPVDRYLTTWHLPVSYYNPQGVTVRRLLSHTAGLAGWNHPGAMIDAAKPTPLELLSGADSWEALEFIQQPGSRAKYSNGGYVLLQLLVEDVTGVSFSEYMQRQVFDPLRMQHSSYQPQPLTATGYDVSAKPVEPRWYPEAAGGLYSTAADLATWLAAGMTGPHGEPAGRGILQAQTLYLMYTLVPVDEGKSYGLGYDIEILPDGTRMIWHSGDVLGWRGQFAALPDQGDGIIILTNSNVGRYVVADVICNWTRWVAGDEPKSCHIYQAIYLVIPVMASVIGLGVAVSFWRLAAQVRSGKRRLFWPPRTTKQRQEILLPLIVIALWWFFVVHRLGPHLPPSFNWISLGFTLWCLVTAINGLTVKAGEPR